MSGLKDLTADDDMDIWQCQVFEAKSSLTSHAALEANPPPGRSTKEKMMAARAKARILVADDESLYRLMMKSMLQTIQCEVVGEARDGEEAVELYRALQPDFALLDINMPRMSGDNALRTIKAEFPNARVIMMTSLADAETVKTCLTLGAIQYIRKDTQPTEIKALILKLMQQAAPAARGLS